MKRPISPLLALAPLILVALSPADARAQAPAPPLGAKVIDAKGKTVGKVEKIISGRDGRALQVEVRVDRVLRTLSIDALAPGPRGAYVCVLSRAEVAALPPSD